MQILQGHVYLTLSMQDQLIERDPVLMRKALCDLFFGACSGSEARTFVSEPVLVVFAAKFNASVKLYNSGILRCVLFIMVDE